jgi:hypothetical protein
MHQRLKTLPTSPESLPTVGNDAGITETGDRADDRDMLGLGTPDRRRNVNKHQPTVPAYLRPRREKIFGPAPSRQLDGNAKARVWAAAAAYNAQNRRQGQHQGPLTWATLRVLRTLLWRFHGADGGGRCFPSYERIAAAAKCARSSVALAIKALEDTGLLTWCNRIARIRRRERDLFGRLVSVWQVVRISNGYTFGDPLEREPGRKAYKSENPTGPQNLFLKSNHRGGARLITAPVYPAGETSEALMMRSGWFHGSKRG